MKLESIEAIESMTGNNRIDYIAVHENELSMLPEPVILRFTNLGKINRYFLFKEKG